MPRLGTGRPSVPLTGMALSRGQDDTVALRSRVRARALPESLEGQVWDPRHPPHFSCPQMHRLTIPMLLRALAQATRTGRTKGAFFGPGGVQCPSMRSQQHSITLSLQGIPVAGASTAAQRQPLTVSPRAPGASGFSDHGPPRGRGEGLALPGALHCKMRMIIKIEYDPWGRV